MKKRLIYSLILVAGLVITESSQNKAFSQDKQNAPAKEQMVKYTCPMHPEVIADNPGECSKCGMALEKKEKMMKDAKMYTCSMHPEVMMDKPGKCPKCGMQLMKKERKQDMTDSTGMMHEHKKMMHDSTSRKHGNME